MLFANSVATSVTRPAARSVTRRVLVLVLASVLGLSPLFCHSKEAGAASPSQPRRHTKTLPVRERQKLLVYPPVNRIGPFVPDGWEPGSSALSPGCVFSMQTVKNGAVYVMDIMQSPKDPLLEHLGTKGTRAELRAHAIERSKSTGSDLEFSATCHAGRAVLFEMENNRQGTSKLTAYIFVGDIQYAFVFFCPVASGWNFIPAEVANIISFVKLPGERPGIGLILPQGWLELKDEPLTVKEHIAEMLKAVMVETTGLLVCGVYLLSEDPYVNEQSLREMSPEEVTAHCSELGNALARSTQVVTDCGREEYFGLPGIYIKYAAKDKGKDMDGLTFHFYSHPGPFVVSFDGEVLEEKKKEIMTVLQNAITLMSI